MSDYSKADAKLAEYKVAFAKAKNAREQWHNTCYGSEDDRMDAFLAAMDLLHVAYEAWKEHMALWWGEYRKAE